jgi:hypothetical protein
MIKQRQQHEDPARMQPRRVAAGGGKEGNFPLHPRIFFSTAISEILPETGIIATLREIQIPFKKIRFNLNLDSRIRTN